MFLLNRKRTENGEIGALLKIMEEIQMNLSFCQKIKNGYDPMIEGVRWTERYTRRIEQLWKYLPNWLAHTIATIAVFLLASGIQGNL